MTSRIAVAAKERLPWRSLVPAMLASALLALVISHASLAADGALTGASTGVPASASSAAGASRRALDRLSPAARASISATLGADDPAYHFSHATAGLQASNGAQHLEVMASRAGVSVRRGALQLGLSLQAIGYGDSLQSVASPLPASVSESEANRVTYARPGVSEWYVNGPLGLEQGFTVMRPGVQTVAGPLTLAISLAGNARASLAGDGHSVQFSAGSGADALRYGGLSVTDASGRLLPSSLELRGNRLLVRVDARGARFPLRVDPAIEVISEVAQEKLVPNPSQELQRAGVSVALSADGNTALVGGPRGSTGEGAVWVFTRSNKVYKQEAELTVQDAEASAWASCGEQDGDEDDECGFGSAVALSAEGSTAVVGAPWAKGRAGAAFVFTRSASGWGQGVELTSPEASAGGAFGRSVAMSADGQMILVGAPGEHRGHGRAWVFTGSGATWEQLGEPLAAGEVNGEARFGKSVALSGNGEVALVGAPGEEEHRGGVWVFEGSPSQGLQRGVKLRGAGATVGARFGFSVALSGDGDTALVGAPDEELAGAEEAGSAWAYTRSGSQWSQQGPQLHGEGEVREQLGYSVALAAEGEAAVVGAPRAQMGTGEAWVFERSGEGWDPTRKLIARGGGEEGKALFGLSVASSAQAEALLIGAPANGEREGAAWVVGNGPTITSVEPESGSPLGGTSVTIRGQHFIGVTAVEFGSVQAESFEVTPEGTIIAVSPPGAGTVHITVTTSFGVSEEQNPADEFTYERPAVTSVKPRSGPRSGGKEVEIVGRFFTGATAVHFGSANAESFKVESDGLIRAVSPAGTGTVNVTVSTPAGTTETTAADRFTYVEAAETSGGRNGDPEPSPNGNSSSGSTQSGSGERGSGQVLSFGSASGASCSASLISKRVGVHTHGIALFRLLGRGAGSCAGKLRLRVKLKLAHGRFLLKTIGTAVFSIAAGKRVDVKVKLNATGRRLLANGHGKLNGSLLIVRSVPTPVQSRTASVQLKVVPAVKPKPAAKPKPTA